MKNRVISAIIMMLIVIPLMIVGGIPYALGIGLISCIAYKELLDLKKNNKDDFPILIKAIGLISLLMLVYTNYEQYGLLFGISYKIISGIVLFLSLPIIFYKKKYKIVDLLQILSIVIFLGIAFNLFISVYNYSVKYFILLLLTTILTDTFALFGGTLIGKHAFTSISPNKTIEGCVVGSLVSTFVCTIYYINVIGTIQNLFLVIAINLVLSLIGQCGDLFFSAIKREFEKKDFSSLIPGHGGVLDRLDSIIFVLLAFVLVMNYI